MVWGLNLKMKLVMVWVLVLAVELELVVNPAVELELFNVSN